MRATFCLLAGALVACTAAAPPPGEPVTAARQPIVNGENDPGDPAVVALLLGGAGLCSGTIVSPRTILTAAHCVAGLAPGEITAVVTSNIFGFDKVELATVDHRASPDADIAMVTLAEPSLIPPIPIHFDTLVPLLSKDIRVIGFGVTSTTGVDSGQKRMGVTKVHHYEDDIMFHGYVGSGVCFGDSGGPNTAVIDGIEQVVAVHSFVTGGCGGGGDGSVRTDTTHRFLRAYIAEVEDHEPPTISIDSPATGTAIEPESVIAVTASDDYDLQRVDLRIDGVYVGASSTQPFELVVPANVALGPHTLTVVATDWAEQTAMAEIMVTVNAGCVADADCDAARACIDGRCVLDLGAECELHGACASGQCNLDPEGDRACTTPCAGDSDCPDGFGCVSASIGAPTKCWAGYGPSGCAIARPGAAGGGSAPWLLVGVVTVAAAARRRRKTMY